MRSFNKDSPQVREQVESWLARFGSWLLIGIALFLLLPGTWTLPLLDQDEPTYAEIAREMKDNNAWIVPRLNGQPVALEKSVFAYWLMRASYGAFGVNEFAARFPSIVTTIGLLLVVNAIGRRWFSARVGFAAAFGLLTCQLVLIVGRGAVTDMPMILSVAVAQYACFHLLRHVDSPYPWRWFAVLYGALAVGSLTKGPVAAGVLALTLLFHRFVVWRRPVAWRNLRLAWGLPLLGMVIAAWVVPAVIETNGELWRVGIMQRIFRRGMEPMDDRTYFVGYYAVLALGSLMPWIACVGHGVQMLRRHWSETNAYLVAWFLGLHLALAFYATQLPHYVLPCFPAFFLIVAQSVDMQQPVGRWTNIWFRLVMLLYLLCVTAAGVFCLTTEFSPPYAVLRTALLTVTVLFAGLAALGLCYRFGWYTGMGVALVIIAAFPLVLGSALRQVTPTVHLQELFAQLPGDIECVAYGYTGPGLLFYSHRRWTFPKEISELREIAQKPGARVLVLVESRIHVHDYLYGRLGGGTPAPVSDRDWVTALKVSSYNVRRIEGIDTLQGAWMKLVVLYRD